MNPKIEFVWQDCKFANGGTAYTLLAAGRMVGQVQPVIGHRREGKPSGWVWTSFNNEEFGTRHQHTGDEGRVYSRREDAQDACRAYVESCLIQRGLLPVPAAEESDGEATVDKVEPAVEGDVQGVGDA